MSRDEAKKKPSDLNDRIGQAMRDLGSLSAEAAGDPAARARLDAALRALRGEDMPRNAAMLENPADARALVRDVVAEELSRYWDRRFGGTP